MAPAVTSVKVRTLETERVRKRIFSLSFNAIVVDKVRLKRAVESFSYPNWLQYRLWDLVWILERYYWWV